MTSTRGIGDRGEQFAVAYLERHGITVLERNYATRHGEIDIIGLDGDEVVFVEVKTRRTPMFGAPEDAVTPKKQERIRRTAERYVEKAYAGVASCRFDVVAIAIDGGVARITHYKNAFT
ncbi:MAG TPA: YraN family protein [Bacteroidota bacterium]|nr:YraN family protein [Bacteroidota bacterium]